MFARGGPSLLELTRQALSSTDEGYDLLAPKFDKTPFRTPDALLHAMAPIFASAPVEDALDLCCGTGAAARTLQRVATRSVVGLDRSAGMLAEARRQSFPTEGASPVTYVRADALSLPFGARFDLVVSFGAFGHILEDHEDRLCANIYRALKPGGRFVFATSTMPPLTSATYWIARGFNAVMRVRNRLMSPPFIMYYLTFLWPDVAAVLERAGFHVEAEPLEVELGSRSPEHRRIWAVTARKPG